jgi:hypothetical protein
MTMQLKTIYALCHHHYNATQDHNALFVMLIARPIKKPFCCDHPDCDVRFEKLSGPAGKPFVNETHPEFINEHTI